MDSSILTFSFVMLMCAMFLLFWMATLTALRRIADKLGDVIYHLQAIDGVLTVISIRVDAIQQASGDESDE